MGDESSGTEAGYNYAANHNLTRDLLMSYDMRSQSFYDGMVQYVEEQEAIEKAKEDALNNPPNSASE